MPNICAMVMNSARARYFVLNATDDPETEGGPELVEHRELANPEATIPERTLFTNLRGSNRSHGGGPEHNYDDHRGEHVEEINRRFAKDTVAQALEFSREQHAHTLIVAANPAMLGKLRPLLANHANHAARVVECVKDLSAQPAQAIHQALASEGLVPARNDPTHTRNGRRR
jgi:protein required for attachment to host cells